MTNKVGEDQERYRRGMQRLFGSAPWLKTIERKRYRVKVFKSGNSVALRLPAELGLEPGTEMDLTAENGVSFSFEPVERPKKKLNVAKFWGTVPDLEPRSLEERMFETSRRPWDDPDWTDGSDGEP